MTRPAIHRPRMPAPRTLLPAWMRGIGAALLSAAVLTATHLPAAAQTGLALADPAQQVSDGRGLPDPPALPSRGTGDYPARLVAANEPLAPQLGPALRDLAPSAGPADQPPPAPPPPAPPAAAPPAAAPVPRPPEASPAQPQAQPPAPPPRPALDQPAAPPRPAPPPPDQARGAAAEGQRPVFQSEGLSTWRPSDRPAAAGAPAPLPQTAMQPPPPPGAPPAGSPPAAAGGSGVAAAPPPPDTGAAAPAARVPDSGAGGRSNLTFAIGEQELDPAARQTLDAVVTRLQAQPETRLQILAYASGDAENAPLARRLSLLRALNVRSYLADAGIRSARLDVRALGAQAGSDATLPPDRVELVLVTR